MITPALKHLVKTSLAALFTMTMISPAATAQSFYFDLDLSNIDWQAIINGTTSSDVVTSPVLPGDSVVGVMSGTTDVSGGSFNYSLPIVLPPGRAGMQPTLAISYSSGGGSGLLGVGATVQGLSAITRCPQTIRQDGQNRAVQYDELDGFCLNGQRLIRVSGTPTTNSEFRTEMDTLVRVKSYSYSSTYKGPTYFRVWTKDGQIQEFGNTSDSKAQLGSFYGNAPIALWAMNKQEDTAGNAIDYTYQKTTTTGEHLPIKIAYVGGEIDFLYENRPDSRSGYLAGTTASTTKRLKAIETKHAGSVVRRYDFQYSYADNYTSSRLLAVTECNGTGECLPTTQLKWKGLDAAKVAWQDIQESTSLASDDRYTFTGDFNGDGFTDYISNISSTTSPSYFYMKLGVGSETRAATWRVISPDGDTPTWGKPEFSYSGDFNGDSLEDLASFDGENVHMFLSTGSGFEYHNWKIGVEVTASYYGYEYTYTYFANAWGPKEKTWIGDFTGDGRPDIVSVSGSTAYVRKGTGSGFEWEVWSLSGNWGGDNWTWASDFNRDGVMDIASVSGYNIYMRYANGSGFDYKQVSAGSNNWCDAKWATLGDFNGDGYQDIGCPSGSNFRVRLGTGSGFVYQNWVTTNSWGSPEWQTTTDYNGDGRADIFSIKSGIGYIHLSTGSGLSYKTISAPTNLGNSKYKRYVDFNGDGVVDIFSPSSDHYNIAFGKHPGNPLVEEVDNGLVKTRVAYKRMTGNPDVYEKTNKAIEEDPGQVSESPYIPVNKSQFPILDVIAPSYLVSELEVQTGEDVYNKTYYRYGGMKSDVHGRGNLGFAWMMVHDDQTGIRGYTEFSQQWPNVGSPTYSWQEVDGKRINESSTQYATLTLSNGKTVFPYTKKSTEDKWGLNGDHGGTIVTEQLNPDAYGNIRTIKVSNTYNGQVWKKTTTNTYSNNGSLWHLGRLTKAIVTSEAPNTPAITRQSTFAYDSSTGLLRAETVEPGTSLEVATTYDFDQYGNKVSATVVGKNRSGSALAARSTTTEFGAGYSGRFATKVTNSLGHTETREYDPRFGLMDSMTGPNGLTTQWTYDDWGQKTTEVRADGTSTLITKEWSGDCYNKGSDDRTAWCVTTESTGSAPVTVHYDRFGRTTREVKTGFDGRLSIVETFYDRFGNPKRVSAPFFEGEIPRYATTERDVLGRIVTVNEPGPGFTTRSSHTDYNGLNVIETNAKGVQHFKSLNVAGKTTQVINGYNRSGNERSQITYTYDAVGNLKTTTDDKGNVITMNYDKLGHKISQTDPDMGSWSYQYNSLGELEWQKDAKGQTVTNTYDTLGRLVKRVEAEGTTNWAFDTAAHGKGKLTKVTAPNNFMEVYTYDALGRPSATTTTLPKSTSGTSTFTTRVSYSPITGKPETETRPNGLKVHYRYNDFGYLESVGSIKSELPGVSDFDSGVLSDALQDLVGMINQYSGSASKYYQLATTYENAALSYQQSAAASFLSEAEAESLRSAADTLNQIAGELQSEATLHSAEANRLAQEAAQHTTQYCYYYYAYYCYNIPDQVASSLTQLQLAQQDYADHKLQLADDYVSLAESLNASQAESDYQAALATAQSELNAAILAYNALEQQKAIYDSVEALLTRDAYSTMLADSNFVYYWQANQYDAAGRLTQFTNGNGVVTNHDYEEGTGHLSTIRNWVGWQDIRQIDYSYDEQDNITDKVDIANGVTESFEYDDLDRLTKATTTGTNLNETRSYQYDSLGNITFKTGVGNYYYNGPRPHAVTNAGSASYGYDANGNMTSGDGRSWAWTSFNKPQSISRGGAKTDFLYGPERARYRQIARDAYNNTTTTYYVSGGQYEQVVKPGGKVVKKNYITAGGAQIAIVSEETKTIAGVVMDLLDTKYLHRDAVNSVDMITNQSGMVESYQHYKPFGERGGQIKVLAAGFMASTPNSLSDLLGLHKLVAKGFGGHEELPDVGLIHMNGRVYDAKLGRFASADPHIQAAGNSQSYNRYTYVLNNPLKYTDPSGFFFKWILNKIKRGLSSLSPNMLTILSIASMVLLGPGGAWMMASNTVLNGAIAGAVSGFIGSGGSLKAAVVGGITGAAFGALHGVKADTLMSSQGMKKVFLHGLTGGASSVANGGKFGPGFMSAGFTQAVTLGGGFQALGLKEGAQGWDGRAQNAIAAGIVGGTASVIGGGKFANGAMTGAMSRLFNDLAPVQKRTDLGLVGNTIRDQLTSDYEKKLFENYWQGNGDMVLSDSEFSAAVRAAKSLEVISQNTVSINGEQYTYKVISFYGNDNMDQAYGHATMIFDSKANAVGFKDFYDFDPKNWGVRPFVSELQTRTVNVAGKIFGNAKPYEICYGFGC